MNITLISFTVHFILIKFVYSDHLSYVTLFNVPLECNIWLYIHVIKITHGQPLVSETVIFVTKYGYWYNWHCIKNNSALIFNYRTVMFTINNGFPCYDFFSFQKQCIHVITKWCSYIKYFIIETLYLISVMNDLYLITHVII